MLLGTLWFVFITIVTRVLLLVQTLSEINIYKNSKYMWESQLNSFKIINVLYLANI